MGETLAAGDVLVVTHGTSFEATGAGTLLWADIAVPDCAVLSRPATTKVVVRGAATPKLEWAGGAMSAHLDVASGLKAPSPSPELYLPPGVKHAWRPDPGSRLVAVQMYTPAGPEQRFVGLAAADKAAVEDAGPRDAR